MPHVSRKKLDEKTFEKIFRKLIAVLERAQNQKKLTPLLGELFTETEKTMLAKRLAVVLMLSGDTPQHRISEALFVSPSTVTRLSFDIEIGKYDLIRSISKKDRVDLEKVIWLLLTAGGIMPPRVGRKYWRKKGLKAIIES